MEQLSDVVTLIGGFVASIFLPVIGVFMFYDSKKRKEAAEARKAEAENITTYAEEWKDLYEKKENKVQDLEKKIDSLYDKSDEDRTTIRELRECKFQLELEKQKYYCNVAKCSGRNPPNNY